MYHDRDDQQRQGVKESNRLAKKKLGRTTDIRGTEKDKKWKNKEVLGKWENNGHKTTNPGPQLSKLEKKICSQALHWICCRPYYVTWLKTRFRLMQLD